MKNIRIVAGRELRGFFDHPTAYILAVAFLGLAFFLSFRSLYSMGLADLRSFFDFLPWLLAVFVPAVTMRSLAEERSRGTLEWLIAQPITEIELVTGKFLGSWLFVLATLAGTLPMAVGVLMIGDAPVGPMVAQYVGAALLAAELTAVGLFGSALTRNQITAFIVAALASFVLVLAGTPFTLVAIPTAVAELVARLAVVPHFDSVARGVLDLRDVLYFVSTTALFVGLAYFLVTRERLSRSRGAYRRLMLGVTAGAAAVVVLNLLGQSIHGRLDLTADNLYTLSEGTEEILEGLDDVVTVQLFVSEGLPAEMQTTLRDVRDMLTDYRRAADGRLRVVEVDPGEDEEARSRASSLGIREMQFNVMRQDEFQIRSGFLGLSLQYAAEQEVIPFVGQTDDLEYRLTSTIASMTADRTPRVAFVSGFGARSSFQMPELNQALSERYEVTTVNMEPDSLGGLRDLSPDSFSVVVLVGPTQPVAPAAVAELEDYLDSGGAGLFFVENSQLSPQAPISQPLNTGLGPMLEARGVRLTESMAYDVRSNQTVSLGRQSVFSLVSPYPLWPVAVPAADHPTNRNLESLSLAWAAVLEIADSTRATPIWTTTEFGGRKPAMGSIDPETAVSADEVDPEALATQVLAAAVVLGTEAGDAGEGGEDAEEAGGAEGAAGGRMVVVGDADLLQSQFARGSPQNLSFAANAVDWLAQDERLIEIRSKDRTPPPLVFESDTQRSALRWGNMIGVPLAFVLVGLVRARIRRNRAEELWRTVQTRRGERPS